MAEAETSGNTNKILIAVIAGILFVAGIFGVLQFLGGDDETTETASLDPALLLQLQTACFENDPPLFYDNQGYCYSVDPAGLTDDQKVAARVLPTASGGVADDTTDGDAEADGSTAPAAPAATVAPAAPAAPTTAAPAAPTTTAATATTAPPTTAATAETTTTTTTSTTTTTTAAEPINLPNSGGWSWEISFPATSNGVPCEQDGEGDYPAGCEDFLNGNHSVVVIVENGVVSGSQRISQWGSKRATFSGNISPEGGVAISVDAENLGSFALNGALQGSCVISGGYTHTGQSGEDTRTGSYVLTSRAGGC